MGFSKPTGIVAQNGKPKKEFVRDTSENSIYKKFSVPDITNLITEDCIAYYDADTLYYTAASNQQTKFITVKHITEGWEEELSGMKVFKGLGKGIKDNSWLGMKNLELTVASKEPYTLEDFEITNGQRLKDDHDKCMESAKVQIYRKLKRVKEQFRIPNIVTVVGSGSPFRANLDLCRPYKGNRQKTLTPILLRELKQWGIDQLGAIDCPTSKTHGVIEVDDYVDMMAVDGAKHFNKYGKFNKIAILSDKDGYNANKMLCNPDTYNSDHPKSGRFKYPQAVIVPNSAESVGDIEIVAKKSSSDYKFIGFLGMLWQIATFDNADGYSALGHLNGGMGFGADSVYKRLKPCKTSKEALQETIDIFAEVLPYGVQYTSHKGEDLDVDTMTYLNTYFRVVYMLRSMEDTMDFCKLCKAFKVDTSEIENNNLLTPPTKTYVGNEEHIKSVEVLMEDILKNDFKGLKATKKIDQAVVLDSIKEKLLSINFEDHYEMKQEKKVFDKPLKEEPNTQQ